MTASKFISASIFLLSLVLGAAYLERVFTTENHFNNTMADYEKGLDSLPIDVMIFGSSHAFTAYNPLVIDQEANTLSYNFGSDALRIPFTDLVLEEATKQYKPKLIVLEVYPASVGVPTDEKIKGFHLRVFDHISHINPDKLKSALRIYQAAELPGVYSTTVRNHDKWHKQDFKNLNRQKAYDQVSPIFYKGYLGHYQVLDSLNNADLINFRAKNTYSNSKREFFTDEAKADLKDLIGRAKASGAEVLVVSSPDLRAKYSWPKRFLATVQQLCDQAGVAYLNLNDHYQALDLQFTDFKDPSHLNVGGAYKTSKFFAEYLNENYVLPDRSSEVNSAILKSQYNQFKLKLLENETVVFKKAVSKYLEAGTLLDSIRVSRSISQLEFKLYFNPTEAATSKMDDYKLLVKVIPKPTDLEKVNARNAEKGWKYDKIDLELASDTPTVKFTLNTLIQNVAAFELSLYNKEKYQGLVGEKIRLNAVEFE